MIVSTQMCQKKVLTQTVLPDRAASSFKQLYLSSSTYMYNSYVCVHVSVCRSVCVRMCVYVCMPVCVHVYACVCLCACVLTVFMHVCVN